MLKKCCYFFSILFLFSCCSQTRQEHAYVSQFSNDKNINLKTLCGITNLAQAAIWLNDEELVIGRWDGTITIFSYKDSLSVLQALVTPMKQGITMLERINDFVFISSNGSSSIALWERNEKEYFLKNTYNFNSCFGEADSAKVIEIENQQFLLTGHSEGYLLIWKFTNEGLSLLNFINLRSNYLLDSPYKLWNIRSILSWKNQMIITASEDGDLCMVDVLKGAVVLRQKYNENAKRGINHIFISGDYLLLSNCTVGPSDRNLWLYQIEKDKFVYLDSKKLIANENLEQAFSFDVAAITQGENIYFFCSTEEGLLWFGQIENDSLRILNYKKVSPQGGAALTILPISNRIASVGYNIHLLEVSDAGSRNEVRPDPKLN